MKHRITLTIGPATFRLGSPWREPITWLKRLYADYPQQPDAIADFTVRLDPAGPLRRWLHPSVRIAGDHMLADAAPMALRHGLLAAEMGMNLQMALGWRRHLLIHASSVEKGGRVLVMTGESGSGKSTLAALLGERGWRFMGDEFALIDLDDGRILPFPRLVSLKNAAIDVMRAEVHDEGRFGPLLFATPKGDIRHLAPPRGAIGRMGEGAPPALLLFPRFGADPELRPVGQAEVFVRLTQASTNYVACGERGFDALHRFVTAVPAMAMDFPDGDRAVGLVEDLWSQLS
ncbi:HprK-related kinase A [Sphingobium subterraneum]|uniref:HprK-related kinase A n=1 Tax=Sphingobium subterraneum TaxID=627688 RepID=A0A841ITW2_9SPHN|nr:HprK-related kinase A [Sphingobium subterraneum]MBB6122349.1 HprK-related kinase A [Sphingobium subterraneum]